MGRRLIDEDLEFIEKNWLTMSNVQIANALGINKVTVSQKGRELVLPYKTKLFSGKYERTEKSPDIVNYGPGSETILENAARKKTLEIEKIKGLLNENNSLKLKVKGDTEKIATRIIDGTVVQKNDSFIAVKLKNYVECFGYADFLIGKAVII